MGGGGAELIQRPGPVGGGGVKLIKLNKLFRLIPQGIHSNKLLNPRSG